MKKFVLVQGWGCRGDCTVRGYNKIAESNDYYSLRETLHLVYTDDGKWYYTRVVKRAEAKSLGLT